MGKETNLGSSWLWGWGMRLLLAYTAFVSLPVPDPYRRGQGVRLGVIPWFIPLHCPAYRHYRLDSLETTCSSQQPHSWAPPLWLPTSIILPSYWWMRNAYKADHLLGNTCTLTGSLLASLVAQTVKHPLAMWVDLGSIHGLGNPLEDGMATHSSILAWRIPWTEKPGRPQSMGSQRVRHDWVTKHSTALLYLKGVI